MSKGISIRAEVHQGILAKADRLFRNDDAGVWVELLQNVRRAGASCVDVTIADSQSGPDTCNITIHDNGRGISDFHTLLSLGGSGWDGETQTKEDPAGMGFFALCRSEVQVQSGNRTVNLSPAVFLGQRDAEVREVANSVQGTRICFARNSSKSALITSLQEVSEFCPLAVFLDGEQLPQHDLLDGARHREVIDGIEVGFATAFTHRWSTYHDKNWNFYGALIGYPMAGIEGFFPPEKVSPVSLYARFNVLETSRIKLQLPDRRAIIEDEFLKSFLRKARAAAYRFFEKQDRHALPFKNWREAKELGILLPESACLLYTWHAPPLDDALDPLFGYPERTVLNDRDGIMLVASDLPDEHTLEGALNSGASLPNRLYKEEPQFVGYAWYDALQVVTNSAIFIDGRAYEEWCKSSEERPQQIDMELTVENPAGSSHETRLPALIHVDSSNGCEFVAVRHSPWDNDDLKGPFSVTDFLINATFRASDDWGEADSWDTQHDAYNEDIERQVNAYFRGPRATLLAILRKAIEWEADHLAEQLGVTELRFLRKSKHDWDVQLVAKEASLPSA
ncbi:MAG TPA: ATP-binding protein [Candidatus Angelobacter sp.]|nr:ATP-binding protein [Candidatus Angelobacter sp.]